ncbi:MAG: family 20 glycosylhydrolase, partial [Acidimicrobiales bacterium]
AVMAEHGFSNAAQLQGLFTTRLIDMLLAEGHEVIAWDEVMDAGVVDGVVIAAWRSSSKAVQAARSGLDVIMAPMQFLYFDWLSSDLADEPVALAPLPYFTPWEKVYRFSVIPTGLEVSLHHHVRGAQVQLWTEYIATRDHLDYMAFPRIVAFSEVVWGTATSEEQFRPRLTSHLHRLEVMGVRYRPLDAPL